MNKKIQNRMLAVVLVVSISLIITSTSNVSAEESKSNHLRIIVSGDKYVDSNVPTQIPFEVKALDSYNDQIPVECDKLPNTLFKVGKTTVRCMAVDSFGNEVRKSFVVTVGYNIVQIPNWFKQITVLWLNQNLSDEEYTRTLEFLIDKEIIHVPYTKSPKNYVDLEIPVWIKTNSEKWVDGSMSNDEFSIGIQWMLDNGMVKGI